MAKKSEKLVYITYEGEGDERYPLINYSVADAYISTTGPSVAVEVYRLVKTVSVTRDEIYNEEVI